MNAASVILRRPLSLIIFNTCASLYIVRLFSMPGWDILGSCCSREPRRCSASLVGLLKG